jgi:hypothetical protein
MPEMKPLDEDKKVDTAHQLPRRNLFHQREKPSHPPLPG